MNAKDFKALAELVAKADEARCNPNGWNKYPMNIEIISKKEALNWLTFTDSELDFIGDEDSHVYVYCGDKFYADEEVTPSILKKADYIELSYADGYAFYVGKCCDEKSCEDAFLNSLGWHINHMIEFDEISDNMLTAIADLLGTTVEELKKDA
jgi:hypothetical protein